MRLLWILAIIVVADNLLLLTIVPERWFGCHGIGYLCLSQLPLMITGAMLVGSLSRGVASTGYGRLTVVVLLGAIFTLLFVLPFRVVWAEYASGKSLVVKSHAVFAGCSAYARDHAGQCPANLGELVHLGYVEPAQLTCAISGTPVGSRDMLTTSRYAEEWSDFVYVGAGVNLDLLGNDAYEVVILYSKPLFLRDKRLVVFGADFVTQVASTEELRQLLRHSAAVVSRHERAAMASRSEPMTDGALR